MNRDREAERWEEDYSRRGRVWGGAVHNLPPLSRGERVLELGCGNGKTSRAILGLTSDVVGIDLSASAVRLCRAHAPGSSGGQLALADARSLPFFDAVFDAVVAFHVIGHLPAEGRARSAHEAARVLRAGVPVLLRFFARGFPGWHRMRNRTGNVCTEKRDRHPLLHRR